MAIAAALAASTVLEAVRSRLAWVFAAVALTGFAGAGFVGALALTETRQLQAALMAAALRLALVVLVSAFAAVSVAREADDRVRDLVLALPVARHHYLLGKLAGLGAVALCGACVLTLPLLPFAPPAQCALWCVTLACEASIAGAFALFCAGGLAQATAALAATLAFYVLARAAGSIALLAAHGGGMPDMAAATLAALLPGLDGFARTEWLLYANGGLRDLALCLGQTIIYVGLLGAAAAFDLQRKEIA